MSREEFVRKSWERGPARAAQAVDIDPVNYPTGRGVAVTPDADHPWWTPREVADMFNISIHTVRDWIRAGMIEAHKIGRIYRIPQDALDDFVEKTRVIKG
jgi:excisionase family DNA binding protein